MAVKIRLMRMGKKRSAHYRVVVIDGRAPRDGRYIDLLGRYDPSQQPSLIEIDADKAVDWLKKGAQPTEPVRKLLEISGAMSKFKVASGKIHTIAPKAAPATPPPSGEEPAPEEVVAEADETAAEVADSAGEEE
jgi:small subunit ribosomal protein S16